MQAAVGLVQLGSSTPWLPSAARSRALPRRARDIAGLLLPADPPYGTTNYQSYVVRLDDELPIERDAA